MRYMYRMFFLISKRNFYIRSFLNDATRIKIFADPMQNDACHNGLQGWLLERRGVGVRKPKRDQDDVKEIAHHVTQKLLHEMIDL